jgi:hypothetical protein
MLPIELAGWAARHGVSAGALFDLAVLLGADVHAPGEGSEARAQSEIRLACPRLGLRLWRNNKGALPDSRGVPVRFGLANDSKALGERLRSSDLVGWRRLYIQPKHVGTTVAQFVAVECKAPGWRYSGDEHEQGQQRWLALVAADGGLALFATGAAELDDAVNRT